MAVLAYIEEFGKVLFIRRGTPPYTGYWCLPGGGTEKGEDPREACIREVKEETGFDAKIIEEIGRVRSAPVYSCRITTGERKANPPETLEVTWLSYGEAMRRRIPPEIMEFLEEKRW